MQSEKSLAVPAALAANLSSLSASPPSDGVPAHYVPQPSMMTEDPQKSNEVKPAATSQPASSNQSPKEEPTKWNPALKVDFAWGDSMPERLKDQYLKLINVALTVVQFSPPPGDHLFNWQGDHKPLENKTFQFLFTTSSDDAFKKLTKDYPGGVSNNTDAATFTIADPQTKKTDIFCVVLLDKVFFENGKERPDAMTRIEVALAHEIYGNVQQSLRVDPSQVKPPTYADRKKAEETAFKASVEFIERFQKDPKFRQLPQKIQKDFEEALKREKLAYAAWQKDQEPPKKP